MPGPLFQIDRLTVEFPRRGSGLFQRGTIRAVDGVSFDVEPGEAVGIVGESGSGKSTVARAMIGLTRAASGRVLFDGHGVAGMGRAALRAFRRRVQMIFQDPGGSLNPRIRVGDAVAEPLIIHGLARGASASRMAGEAMERVGLPAALGVRYPHELSGGQKQRAVIARALTLSPGVLICDEPTSALDVSVQAQVLNLLADLRRAMNLTLVFVSHDLGVVRHVCDRVVVMHHGRIVERGACGEVFDSPREAYTKALVTAVPGMRP
ncbi:MAG: ABC transporter ATP-binding protein [Phycisphaeraceae bacterium]|nr:MAG: ABC transporter ATP-binding protein [Phycisphaeraceae bacterium]